MSEAGDVIAVGAQAGIPTLVWGAPGVGKTSYVNALAAALGVPCETVIASIREPSDFSGLPVIADGGVRFAPPAWAVRLAAAGKGLVFFDEISTAAPAVQAGLLRVILDRVVGDLALPPGVHMLGAANPPEQAAGGWDLSAPLANRFCHVTWNLAADVWVDGMLQGWPVPTVRRVPETWELGVPQERGLVASFVRVRPTHLLAVPKDVSEAGRAWPSPRTWDMAARLAAACGAAGVSGEVTMLGVAGCVGAGAATEFFAWRRDLDLPDPEALLAEPTKFKLPKRGDQQFAVLASVAAAAGRQLTPERWLAAWTIMARGAEQGAKDVAAAAVRALAKAAEQRSDLALPKEQLKPFLPLLRAVGALGG